MKSKNPLVYSNLACGFPRGAHIQKSTQSGSRHVSALILRSAVIFSTFVLSVDDYLAWLNRGLALEELEEYDIAIASFDKVIELKPDSYKAWNHRGYGLVRLGRDEEALLCFDKALSIQPDYANAYYSKAACYALQRKVELALLNLHTAIDLNPSYKNLSH